MFDSISSERSPVFRIVFRAVFSLGAGAILAFVLPWLLIAIDEYVSPAFSKGFLMKSVFTVLNLPGAIYCTLLQHPDTLPNSDRALYCFAIGIFLNIPFYAIMIFLLSSWFKRSRNKKLQLEADR